MEEMGLECTMYCEFEEGIYVVDSEKVQTYT